jgi:hypothetical protein
VKEIEIARRKLKRALAHQIFQENFEIEFRKLWKMKTFEEEVLDFQKRRLEICFAISVLVDYIDSFNRVRAIQFQLSQLKSLTLVPLELDLALNIHLVSMAFVSEDSLQKPKFIFLRKGTQKKYCISNLADLKIPIELLQLMGKLIQYQKGQCIKLSNVELELLEGLTKTL